MPSTEPTAGGRPAPLPDKPSTAPESVSAGSLSRFNSAHSLISATSLARDSQDGGAGAQQPSRPPTGKPPKPDGGQAPDRVKFRSTAEVLTVDYTPLNRLDSESSPDQQQPVDAAQVPPGRTPSKKVSIGLPSQASIKSQSSLKRQPTGRGGSTVTFSTHADQVWMGAVCVGMAVVVWVQGGWVLRICRQVVCTAFQHTGTRACTQTCRHLRP